MMKIAIIAVLCHLVSAGDHDVRSCRDVTVFEGEEGMGTCNFAQAIVAQWLQANRKYDGYTVEGYRCRIG